MGNIKNFNFNKLDMYVSNSDYWDLFLSTGNGGGGSSNNNGLTSGDCFVVWYDFNNPNIFSGDSIHSLVYWTGATNTGYSFNTIGLTGIDNGLILFDKQSGDTSNQALLSALTGSTIVIPSGDSKMFMNPVSGTTGDFIYPINQVVESGFTYSNFCGGFYQGFYKLDGYSYQTLPVRVNHSWSAEFWLKPQDICTETGQTLNDVYTENSGFFFYMGSRAENKFWNQWGGANTGCTSACTVDSGCTDTLSEWCTIPKENDISIVGDYGVPINLNPPQVNIDLITNGFLIYGRARQGGCNCGACSGPSDGLGRETVCTYAGTGVVVTTTAEVSNNTNGFLIYGRARQGGCSCSACSGPSDGYGNQTVCSFSGKSTPQTKLEYKSDIIGNALGFRIKPDGSLGYRSLVYTGECSGTTFISSGISVTEDYSTPIIESNVWSYVVIKFVTTYEDDCTLKHSKPRKGNLMIYVNGRLKKVFRDIDEFVARRLAEYKDKQIGVPFNMSLGGGSQGLLESQTFDGRDFNDLGLEIEQNFAGTFIGGISEFKFNICDLTYADIQHNFNLSAPIHGITINNYGNC